MLGLLFFLLLFVAIAVASLLGLGVDSRVPGPWYPGLPDQDP
jgi:hypothetical protein